MNTANPGVIRKPFRKRKLFKFIAIGLVVALLGSGGYVFYRSKTTKAVSAVAQRTSTVVRGELVDSLAGSAPIESSNRSEISPKVTATLLQINCKEGDQVKKGDILFVLDNTDALLDIENAENSIKQMQLTIDSTSKSVGGLLVKAPFSGQVSGITMKEGDTANKGGTIMTLTDTSRLEVSLAFSGSEAKNIKIGQKATVYLQDLMLSLDGTVTYRSSKPYAAANGGELYNVEIAVSNPGSLTEKMKATAEISVGGTTLESVESGTLSYVNSKVIRSDAGGTVSKLNVRENEYVNAGDVLMELENDDLVLSTSTNDLKMENLTAQLDIKKKQLGYYTITAPFDGTITKMGTANAGDTVKTGESLAILSDINHLQFSVDIDELDISSLKAGQEVQITSDAIEETSSTPLSGKVTNVAMEGTSSNGVTTYPVTVTVDEESVSKLKTGMNVDAEIILNSKSDILMVPLEAVTTMGGRSFVYVKGSSTGTGSGSDSPGQNSGNSGFGGMPADNTSGAGMRGYPPDGFAPPAGNTSGTAMQGNPPEGFTPPTGNTSGSGMRGQRRSGNTSGAGINGSWNGGSSGSKSRGNWTGNTTGAGMRGSWTGSTSQGAMKGSFARARNAGMDSYYNGATMVEVQTGISNDSYIEISSGLSEGDVVILPKTSTVKTTGSSSQQGNRNGGMGGSMGGFSGGGMPGGGPGGF